jgi:DNA polymerase IV (DinB-like DNA polymerase)
MNRPLYEQVSGRIMELLRAYADSFEKMGIDEGYLDISTRANGGFEQAKETAADVKREVLDQEQITCSIGIAPNKLVAKIASDEKKPDGLTIVRPEDVDRFLEQMPVSRIPGVGRKVEEKLAQIHVETIPQLSAVNPSILVETFGKSLGSYLFKAARGEDDDPVKEREQPTQLSRIATLKQNTRETSEIQPVLDELTQSVTDKLKERNMKCRSIGVITILTDLSIHTKSKTLESPTSDATILKRTTNELIAQFLESSPSAIIRRAGVRLSDLSKPAGQTDISKFLTA